jgi:hypothetical protein
MWDFIIYKYAIRRGGLPVTRYPLPITCAFFASAAADYPFPFLQKPGIDIHE